MSCVTLETKKRKMISRWLSEVALTFCSPLAGGTHWKVLGGGETTPRSHCKNLPVTVRPTWSLQKQSKGAWTVRWSS